MAKVTLGNRPKSFPLKTVTADMPEGGVGDIGVVFKYRTRSEYAEYSDTIFTAAQVEVPAVAAEDTEQGKAAFNFSLAEALSKTADKQVGFLLDVIDSWDLPHELTRQTLTQLCDELPGLAIAVITKYREMCVEGRLGN